MKRFKLPVAPGSQTVKSWPKPVTVHPTLFSAVKNPIFLERRVYQGSWAGVPAAFYRQDFHRKAPRSWQAIHLENEVVRGNGPAGDSADEIHVGLDKAI